MGEFRTWASLEVDEFRGGRVRDFERFGRGRVLDVGPNRSFKFSLPAFASATTAVLTCFIKVGQLL